MVSVARLTAAGLALTWLVACGSSEPKDADTQNGQDDQTAQEAAAPAPDVHARQGTKDETVFDDMIRTEDKARSVEGTVMQGKANTDAAIEAAESGNSPEPPAQDQ
jgi:hypothetical protein